MLVLLLEHHQLVPGIPHLGLVAHESLCNGVDL